MMNALNDDQLADGITAALKIEYPSPEPLSSFAGEAETVQNLRKVLQVAAFKRGKRGQPDITHVQAEALARIVADIARLTTYDGGDPISWNSIMNNCELGKG